MKIGTTCLASCSGCHIAILDLNKTLFDVLDKAEIAYSPILMDIKNIPEIDVAIVEGAVRHTENEQELLKMREKAKTLIAIGTCACFGGIPGLGSIYRPENILKRVYRTESTEIGVIPDKNVPLFKEAVRPIDSYVGVDYYLSGCPPTPEMIANLLVPLLEGKEPEPIEKPVCGDCERKVKHEKVAEVKRTYEKPDLEECLLSQGFICLGSVTMGGCGAPCTAADIPCQGCRGPTKKVLRSPCKDVMNVITKRISRIAGIPEGEIVRQIRDLPRNFYTFTFSSPVMSSKIVSRIPELYEEK